MKYLTAAMAVATACGMLWGAAQAQEATARTDWEGLRAQARELRQQADRLRTEAKQTYAASERACWDKFLVSSCQEDARAELRKTERKAREIDLEALALERRVRAHERELKLEKKRERDRQREAKRQQKQRTEDTPQGTR